jgi:hypothetical protein
MLKVGNDRTNGQTYRRWGRDSISAIVAAAAKRRDVDQSAAEKADRPKDLPVTRGETNCSFPVTLVYHVEGRQDDGCLIAG